LASLCAAKKTLATFRFIRQRFFGREGAPASLEAKFARVARKFLARRSHGASQ